MEFFVSMVTPGMVGPRLERLLFGCLGALALVLVLVWWRAGPDVAPHALALLALTALLAASLFWSPPPARTRRIPPPTRSSTDRSPVLVVGGWGGGMAPTGCSGR
jgi:hypothetical protein